MNTPSRPSDSPSGPLSDPRADSPSDPRTEPGRSRGGARIRLLVVDDHPVVRSGIVGMLCGEEDLDVAGQAADGAAAVELAGDLAPDGVLNLPAARALKTKSTNKLPSCRIPNKKLSA